LIKIPNFLKANRDGNALCPIFSLGLLNEISKFQIPPFSDMEIPNSFLQILEDADANIPIYGPTI
jgi:hypothetical protein